MLISVDGISAHATLSLKFYGAHVFCPRWHVYDLARTVGIVDIACNLWLRVFRMHCMHACHSAR